MIRIFSVIPIQYYTLHDLFKMNVPDEVVLVCLAGLTSEPAGAGWEDGARHQGLPGQQQGDHQQHPLQCKVLHKLVSDRARNISRCRTAAKGNDKNVKKGSPGRKSCWRRPSSTWRKQWPLQLPSSRNRWTLRSAFLRDTPCRIKHRVKKKNWEECFLSVSEAFGAWMYKTICFLTTIMD